MNQKEISVVFVDEKLSKNFERLKSGPTKDRQLYKFIDRATDDLKKSPTCGTKIPRDLWPKGYLKKYGINNLWKYDLPNAWRLIYTIKEDKVTIISIVIEWFSHKDYERKFKY